MISTALREITKDFETGYNRQTLMGWIPMFDSQGRPLNADYNYRSGVAFVNGRDYYFVRKEWTVRIWDREATYMDFLNGKTDFIEEVDLTPDYLGSPDAKPLVSLTRCNRCEKDVDKGGWHNGWPNYGRIQLGFAAQASAVMMGIGTATSEAVKASAITHDAVVDSKGQEVTIEWGAGYIYDSKARYRLCYNCQKELLKTVGAFFKFDELGNTQMNLQLGQEVYHKDIYCGREPMKVVGIREAEVELEGDYSGGTHGVCQKDWMPIQGVLLVKNKN